MTAIHIIPTLQDNYTYAIVRDTDAILVDCGEAEPVVDFLKEREITPRQILCTHHHGDHVAGLAGLKAAYPELTVYAPEKDRDRIPLMNCGLSEETARIGGIDFICIETPGHTKNHLCFYSPELKAVFTGDTLFSFGCGRLFEGTPEQMFASLQKIKALPGETDAYCGHEYTRTNIEFSLTITPDDPDLKNSLSRVDALRKKGLASVPVSLESEKNLNLFLKAASPEEFAQLRQLRDKF